MGCRGAYSLVHYRQLSQAGIAGTRSIDSLDFALFKKNEIDIQLEYSKITSIIQLLRVGNSFDQRNDTCADAFTPKTNGAADVNGNFVLEDNELSEHSANHLIAEHSPFVMSIDKAGGKAIDGTTKNCPDNTSLKNNGRDHRTAKSLLSAQT